VQNCIKKATFSKESSSKSFGYKKYKFRFRQKEKPHGYTVGLGLHLGGAYQNIVAYPVYYVLDGLRCDAVIGCDLFKSKTAKPFVAEHFTMVD